MLSRFLDYLRFELNRAPLTVEAYKEDISQFIYWLTQGKHDEMEFSSVTSADVRAWMLDMGKKGYSPRSLRRKIISLRSLFKWLIKNNIIKSSPLQDIPLPQMPKPLPDIVKHSEIEEALKKMRQEFPDKEKIPGKEEVEEKDIPKMMMESLILEMFYSLGIRRAELVGLNDEDISFSKGEIKVTGKRSKQRIVPLPQRLLEQIKEWQATRNLSLDNTKDKSSKPLFIIKGKRITPNQVYLIVRKALEGSNARRKGPHALRHSFASGMLNGGAELDTVKEFLGHASLATTQIYTHISLNEIKKAYESAHPRAHENKK